jgi:hypothetical protein
MAQQFTDHSVWIMEQTKTAWIRTVNRWPPRLRDMTIDMVVLTSLWPSSSWMVRMS